MTLGIDGQVPRNFVRCLSFWFHNRKTVYERSFVSLWIASIIVPAITHFTISLVVVIVVIVVVIVVVVLGASRLHQRSKISFPFPPLWSVAWKLYDIMKFIDRKAILRDASVLQVTGIIYRGPVIANCGRYFKENVKHARALPDVHEVYRETGFGSTGLALFSLWYCAV